MGKYNKEIGSVTLEEIMKEEKGKGLKAGRLKQ